MVDESPLPFLPAKEPEDKSSGTQDLLTKAAWQEAFDDAVDDAVAQAKDELRIEAEEAIARLKQEQALEVMQLEAKLSEQGKKDHELQRTRRTLEEVQIYARRVEAENERNRELVRAASGGADVLLTTTLEKLSVKEEESEALELQLRSIEATHQARHEELEATVARQGRELQSIYDELEGETSISAYLSQRQKIFLQEIEEERQEQAKAFEELEASVALEKDLLRQASDEKIAAAAATASAAEAARMALKQRLEEIQQRMSAVENAYRLALVKELARLTSLPQSYDPSAVETKVKDLTEASATSLAIAEAKAIDAEAGRDRAFAQAEQAREDLRAVEKVFKDFRDKSLAALADERQRANSITATVGVERASHGQMAEALEAAQAELDEAYRYLESIDKTFELREEAVKAAHAEAARWQHLYEASTAKLRDLGVLQPIAVPVEPES